MRMMNRPFWIAGFRIFTTLLYFFVVVPVVFTILFVPLAILMSPIAIYGSGILPGAGAAIGVVILASRFRERRRRWESGAQR